MAKPFYKLRFALTENDIDQKYLGKLLGDKCTKYISQRMTAQRPWDMDEVYTICDLLHIPYEEIPEYFPKGGVVKRA